MICHSTYCTLNYIIIYSPIDYPPCNLHGIASQKTFIFLYFFSWWFLHISLTSSFYTLLTPLILGNLHIFCSYLWPIWTYVDLEKRFSHSCIKGVIKHAIMQACALYSVLPSQSLQLSVHFQCPCMCLLSCSDFPYSSSMMNSDLMNKFFFFVYSNTVVTYTVVVRPPAGYENQFGDFWHFVSCCKPVRAVCMFRF